MFSTSLIIFELVPESTPYFSNRFPGEGWLRPLPQTVIDFVISPIPRALWHNKPIDEADDWRNMQSAARSGHRGTSVSNGLVGWYWLRYGPGGVVEGGLLFGWLLFVIEQVIRLSGRKPLILIIGLGFAEFMFRSFRDLRWSHLHQFLVGIAALWVLSLLTKKQRLDDDRPLRL